MLVLTILSILLVVSFVGIITWRNKELPESISAMVYDLPEGGWRWLWSVWLWLVTVFTYAPMMDVLDARGCGVFVFLTMLCLFLAGAMPLFQTETKKWHYVSAIAGGVLSQVCCCVVLHWWVVLPLWLVFTVLMVFVKVRGKEVLLAEMLCYVTSIIVDFIQ